MRDWRQRRRALLKGLGLGAAGLPLLLARRGWGAPAPRKRLMVIELVNGYRQTYWRPPAGALAGQLPETSDAFDRVKDAMIFLPDLTNPGLPFNGRYLFGVMFYGMTTVKADMGAYREPLGPTVDQVVAKALYESGRRESLALGVQLDRAPHASNVPGGNHCFWSGADQPVLPQGDPVAVYRELFTGGDLTTVRKLLVRRKSILDYVGANLEDFRARSGTEDRAAISAHLESIRDLEGRLMGGPPPVDGCAPAAPGTIDLAAAASYGSILEAHLRLMVGALRCGLTRVATLQTSDVLGFSIDFGAFVPGIPAKGTGYKSEYRNWADLAHNPILYGVDHKKIVDRWFCQRIAEILVQMRSIDEGDGNMLDHTAVLIGNNMQEGSNHDGQKMPWMIGGGGRFLNTGNCLTAPGQSTASVLAGLCQGLGVPHQYGAAYPGLLKI